MKTYNGTDSHCTKEYLIIMLASAALGCVEWSAPNAPTSESPLRWTDIVAACRLMSACGIDYRHPTEMTPESSAPYIDPISSCEALLISQASGFGVRIERRPGYETVRESGGNIERVRSILSCAARSTMCSTMASCMSMTTPGESGRFRPERRVSCIGNVLHGFGPARVCGRCIEDRRAASPTQEESLVISCTASLPTCITVDGNVRCSEDPSTLPPSRCPGASMRYDSVSWAGGICTSVTSVTICSNGMTTEVQCPSLGAPRCLSDGFRARCVP